MKNKSEREQFLKDYRKWGIWREIIEPPVMTMRLYRHDFKNGAIVLVTENDVVRYDGANIPQIKYSLKLLPNDGFNPYDKHSGHNECEFMSYNLDGVGMGVIVDYMTKRKGEI